MKGFKDHTISTISKDLSLGVVKVFNDCTISTILSLGVVKV